MDGAGSVACPPTSGFSIITDELSDSPITTLFLFIFSAWPECCNFLHGSCKVT
jgi:hypothetical protein